MSSKFQSLPPVTAAEVRSFLESMNWSQGDLARATGRTLRTVEKWVAPGAELKGALRWEFAALKAGLQPWRTR